MQCTSVFLFSVFCKVQNPFLGIGCSEMARLCSAGKTFLTSKAEVSPNFPTQHSKTFIRLFEKGQILQRRPGKHTENPEIPAKPKTLVHTSGEACEGCGPQAASSRCSQRYSHPLARLRMRHRASRRKPIAIYIYICCTALSTHLRAYALALHQSLHLMSKTGLSCPRY